MCWHAVPATLHGFTLSYRLCSLKSCTLNPHLLYHVWILPHHVAHVRVLSHQNTARKSTLSTQQASCRPLRYSLPLELKFKPELESDWIPELPTVGQGKDAHCTCVWAINTISKQWMLHRSVVDHCVKSSPSIPVCGASHEIYTG